MLAYTKIKDDRYNTLIQSYDINQIGKDYIVGDIHGCFNQLEIALNKIGFNKQTDRLFCAGDLVDRGPDNELVLSYLEQNWFYSVLGNHEYFAIQYLQSELDEKDYIHYGGKWFVDSDKSTQERIVEQFNRLPLVIELKTSKGVLAIIHGDVSQSSWNTLIEDVKAIVTEQDLLDKIIDLTMKRKRFKKYITTPVEDIDYVVHGHTYTAGPIAIGNVIYIDTGLVFGGHLTILDANTLIPTSIHAIDLI